MSTTLGRSLYHNSEFYLSILHIFDNVVRCSGHCWCISCVASPSRTCYCFYSRRFIIHKTITKVVYSLLCPSEPLCTDSVFIKCPLQPTSRWILNTNLPRLTVHRFHWRPAFIFKQCGSRGSTPYPVVRRPSPKTPGFDNVL